LRFLQCLSSIHFTGPTEREERKKKYYPKAKLCLGNEYGLHVGTLGINEYTDLDPLGIVYRDLESDELPRNDIKEIEQILQASLNSYHPLCILPPEFTWDGNYHLEAQFALIKSKLDNVLYPIDEITPNKGCSIEQLNKIPIDEKKSLLITLRMSPGKLSNSFQWKVRRIQKK